jgi:MFS family permease
MQSKIYGAGVWVVATLFVVYSFSLNTAGAVFSQSIKSSLNASDIQVSLAMGVFILGFACMQIIAGYLLDNYNAKWVVSIGVFLLASGNGLISYAHHLVFFSLANFLQGLGASFAFVAIGVLISQWFGTRLFPILFGLTQTVSCISSAFLHYFFTLALTTQSWQKLYLQLSLFGFILLVFTLIIVKSPKTALPTAKVSLRGSLSKVLKNNQILLCAVAAATSFGILLGYASFWYMQIQRYYSVPKLQAIIVGGLFFIGVGVGTPILAWISNLKKSRVKIIYISLVLGAMMLLIGIYLPHYAVETLMISKIVSFLIGFFLSGAMLFYTIVSEISSDATRGVALSVTNTVVFLFNTLIMFIPYLFITAHSDLFFTYLWIFPFFIMFSLLLLYFIKDSWRAL